MRVAIIGGGLAGLSAAHYLSESAEADVTVFEQASVFGGRANVVDGAEHCARLFLNDYDYLFDILQAVKGPGGRSIYETLGRISRYCHTENSGWVEMSHLYSVFAREVSWREKVIIARANRRSLLLAEQDIGTNTNRYGSFRNYSARSVLRMAANLLRSKVGYALAGPTDEYLIAPWVAHLERSGVVLRKSAGVTRIDPGPTSVAIHSEGVVETFDTVIATAFVSDLAALLDASRLAHRVKRLQHTHCTCFTMTLDPREAILSSRAPSLYAWRGLSVVLQPQHQRCVVVCGRTRSTEASYVAASVEEMLGLRFGVAGVRMRDNQLPEEAIYTADYINPGRILVHPHPRIYFAGSCMKNSYPVDSGEGAARSAFTAVRRMREDSDSWRR